MLDRRLHAYREDLADIALEGKVRAGRFVHPAPSMIIRPVVALRPGPDLSRGIDTELMLGETVSVFEQNAGFAWVQAEMDDYVGYLPQEALGPVTPLSHIVTAPRSFLYPGPDLRLPPRHCLSMGSRVHIVGHAETRGTLYGLLDDGSAIIASHLRSLDSNPPADFVEIAARLIETPYLWGGKSGFGIDCSGLVQLSLHMAGKTAPRDSDMQAVGLGEPVDETQLRRGDLVFWKGHVAILEDEQNLIHASGYSMTVTREPLKAAIGRIEALYGRPTGFRRVI